MAVYAQQLLLDAHNTAIDEAVSMTDAPVISSLIVMEEHARRRGNDAPLKQWAYWETAATAYTRAANVLRGLAFSSHDHYHRGCDRALAMIEAADQLTTLAGESFDMAVRIGHLAPGVQEGIIP